MDQGESSGQGGAGGLWGEEEDEVAREGEGVLEAVDVEEIADARFDEEEGGALEVSLQGGREGCEDDSGRWSCWWELVSFAFGR